MTARDPGHRERTLTAQDGLRLFYRDYGDPLAAGTPVVCLSGLTRNSKDFDVLAARLSARRRVICPDYRGRGRSDYAADWRSYHPRVILGDLVQLLAATGVHRAVICGISFGGILAMALGVAEPTALAGVILDDIGPDLGAAGRARIMDYVSRDHPQPDWDTAVAALRAMFPTLSFKTDGDWRRFTEATFREGDDGRLHFDWDTALVKPFLAESEPRDLWPLYRSLRHVPVLAIRGGLSDVLGEATLTRMAEEKPDLAHLTVPDVGHVPSLTEPETERAIDDLLARVDG
jgi:pimeloyl-ACP methyl ester carboxylesterase